MGRKSLSFSAAVRLTVLLLMITGVGAGLYLISTQRLGTVPKAAPDTPTVRLFFEADTELAPDKEFSLLIKLNPNGASLFGFDVRFAYDPAKVELAGNFLDDLSQAYNADQGFFKKINPDKEKNTVQIYGAKLGGEPIAGADDIELAKIRFKVKGDLLDTDETVFRWNAQETKIAGDNVELNVDRQDGLFALGTRLSKPQEISADTAVQTDNPSPTEPAESIESTGSSSSAPSPASPSPTPQPLADQTKAIPAGPLTTPTLAKQTGAITILLKFQGVVKKPEAINSLPVAITVAGGSLKEPVAQIVLFAPKEDGVWVGDLSLATLLQASNYEILIKGPQHVQKKICDQRPIEPSSGSYRCGGDKIRLGAGAQTLDFSGVLQLVGDLPTNNTRQDRVVNSNDTAFVKNNLLTTNPKILKIADINFDGVVNVVDYALILKTLERGVREDEGV